MSAPTLILTPKKVLVPYDAERYALKSSQVEQGDLCYVADTGKWWLVVDVANLSNDNGYDNIHTDSVAESFTHVDITGTAGNGYITLPSQSSAPAAPAAGNIRIYSDAANKFAWIGASGFTRNFDGTLTASRTYTLPDASGTVAVSGQVFPAANGTTLLPAFTFSADLTAGMLYAGSGGVKIATSALQAVLFSGVDQSAQFSGRVVGTTALNGFNIGGTVTPFCELEVDSTAASSPRGIMSAQFSTDTGGARLHMRKARGTRAAPTVIVSGDNLGRIVGTGYDGTNYLEMASIYFASEGTIAATRIPTNIQFWTATNAAPSVLTEAGRFTSAQHLLLGGLTTDGTGVLQLPAATTSAGGIAFGTDTLAYRSAATVFNIENTGAAQTLRIRTSGSRNVDIQSADTNTASILDSGYSTSGAFNIGTSSSGRSLVFVTGAQVTALTLDSSQNATFAGGLGIGTTGLSARVDVADAYTIFIGTTGQFAWRNKTHLSSPSDGVLTLFNNATTDFGRLQLGGTTSSFPAIKRNGTALNFRLADDSADAPITAAGATLSGSSSVAGDLTLTGTSLLTKVGGTIPLITTSTAITTGAGASVGTLTNSPASGNPTKWVPINDNGTTRYIPAW